MKTDICSIHKNLYWIQHFFFDFLLFCFYIYSVSADEQRKKNPAKAGYHHKRGNIMAEINVTAATFQKEVLESDKPVLVDFWAPWCGPCKMLGPVVAEIAEEHPEIKVCKVNVDDEDELAQQFGVMSIPFVAVFKDGNLTKSTVGFQSKENLLNLI